MYRDTITLFNRHGDLWKAAVLTGVDVNADAALMRATYGENNNDRAKLHVAYTMDNVSGVNTVRVGNYIYVHPLEWADMEDVDLDGFITFQTGNDFDFFLVGEWDGADTIDDTEYLDGFFDHMNRNYECYALSSVAKYSVIPHFEILAR